MSAVMQWTMWCHIVNAICLNDILTRSSFKRVHISYSHLFLSMLCWYIYNYLLQLLTSTSARSLVITLEFTSFRTLKIVMHFHIIHSIETSKLWINILSDVHITFDFNLRFQFKLSALTRCFLTNVITVTCTAMSVLNKKKDAILIKFLKGFIRIFFYL